MLFHRLLAAVSPAYFLTTLSPFNRLKKTCKLLCPPGGELNLDQTGMCHRRLKFSTLFWSGKTQKGYPALELPLFLIYCIVLYCIVLYCIVLYCIVLYCIALHCIALHCIVLYCIVLYCIREEVHV